MANPKPEGGAVAGFAVPLAAGADKEALEQPIKRGIYAISSPDRKTVLKLMVLPKEEAGFDPAAFAVSDFAKTWDPELRNRISATWMILQLTFESYSPQSYEALDFFLDIAGRLALLCDGVVADPVAQVYRLPEQVLSERPEGVAILAADHVQVRHREHEGKMHVFTSGLIKFDLPEVEIYGIAHENTDLAARFLFGLVQSILLGSRLEPGASVGAPDCQLKVAAGGLDRAMWDGIPCLELIPEGSNTSDGAVVAWFATLNP